VHIVNNVSEPQKLLLDVLQEEIPEHHTGPGKEKGCLSPNGMLQL